jgi:hypothetical protein
MCPFLWKTVIASSVKRLAAIRANGAVNFGLQIRRGFDPAGAQNREFRMAIWLRSS